MEMTLFVPVLNEIEGLKKIMPAVPAGLFRQVLVVDGGSTDGTAQWAADQGYDVYVQKKRGLRHAYIEAWPLIKCPGVMTFSPDGNCKPEDIPRIIEKFQEGYDMVIGSRYLPPARSDDDGPVTRFGNWMFTALINSVHGGHFTDVMNIFRAYRTNLFYELDLHKEESWSDERYFFTTVGIEPLLSIRAAKRKLKIGEVPADEPPRMSGYRKLQIFRWGATHLVQVFKETRYWR